MAKVEEPEPRAALISCEHCGKPISKTSKDFGMDCEDDCDRRKLREVLGAVRGARCARSARCIA